MYYVYVLRSLKNGKRYVGWTSEDPTVRLKQHRSGSTQWTKQNGPFELVYTEEHPDKALAIRRESVLKSGHGRQFLDVVIPR